MITQMLPGVIGIVAGALIGVIGVFSNTRKNRALKWILVVLLVLVAAASVHQESKAAQAGVMEREKTVYAESHAAQSVREMEEAKKALERAGEEYLAAKKELTDRLETNQELVQELFGGTAALSDKLGSIEEAVAKGQRNKIAELVKTSRQEARLTLMKVVRRESLLPESEISKIESDLKGGEPIPPSALERIQANMAAKHLLERSRDGKLPASAASPH